MKTADLSIKLVADIADLQRKMVDAQRSVNNSMQSIAKAANVARLALAGLAGGVSLQAFVGLADAATNLNSRLKTVTTSQQELNAVQAKLLDIANRTRSPLEESVNLYAALARSTKDTKASQQDLLTVIETFNKSIAITGGSTESAKAAITQFNQAMASGVLRGEEFNSVSEQAPKILDILGQSLGKTRGELREMAKEGKLTSDVVLLGILEGAKGVNAEFAQMGLTVGGATQVLRNNLVAAVGDLDKATGASSALAAVITAVAESLKGATDFVIRNKDEIKAWAAAISAVGILTILPTLTAGFKALTAAIAGTSAALLANPAGWAALGVGALAYLGIKMYDKITEEKKATEGLNQSLHAAGQAQGENESAAQGAAKAALAAAEAKAKQAKAAEDLKKQYDKLVTTLRSDIVAANAQAQASQNGYNKAQEEFLKLAASPEWKTYSAAQRRQIANLYEQKIAAEAAAEAAKKGAAEAEKMIAGFESLRQKIRGQDSGLDSDFLQNVQSIKNAFDQGRISLDEYVSLVESYIKQQKFYTDQQKAAIEVTNEYADANDKLAEQLTKEWQERQEAIKSAEDMLAQIRFETEALKMTNDEREIAIKLRELESKGIKEGTAEYAKYAEQIKEAVIARETVEKSIEQQKEYARQWERITDQIGQSLTNSLMEGGKSAWEYIKNLFKTLVLRPMLEPIVRGGLASVAGAFGMALPGTAAAASGGGASSLSTGAGLLSLGTAFGTGMAASFSSMMAAGVSGWATAAGSLIGTGAASGIAAGLGMIAAPLAVAALAFEPLFGRKLKSAGIKGDFGGAAGFSGVNFEFYKGGLLRSNKTKIRPLDPATQQSLSATFIAMREQIALMGASLGLGTQAVSDFTKSIKLNFKGLTEAQIQEKIADTMKAMSDEMAQLVLVGDQFILAGESAGDALTRLYSSVTTVNGALQAINLHMFDMSLVGADLASKLADALGGLEKFSQATSFYYENFFTEAERSAKTAEQVAIAFSQLGVAMPTTRQAFRDIVTALDVTTEAGRATFAALMGLAPAFAEITKSAEEMRQEAIDAARAITDSALAALERAIDKQRQLAESSRQVAQESADNLRSVFGVLSSAIDSLTGQRGGMSAAAGQSFIVRALETARATGYLPDSATLADAIESATDGLERTTYATSFEAERDRLILAARLSELRTLTDDQLTIAEQQLQAAEQQLVALDAQLEAARTQIDVLRGVDVSVQSVAAAMATLAAAIQAERAAMTATVAAAAPVIAAQAAQPKPTPQTISYAQAAQTLKAQGIPYGGQAGSTLRTAQDIANFLGATIISSGGSLVASPKFAAGGLHMGGFRLVGENGPELEATGPARYYSSADTMAMLGGGAEVAYEIRQLRDENKAHSRAIVGLQNRMTRLLEQWEGDGLPETRDVSA